MTEGDMEWREVIDNRNTVCQTCCALILAGSLCLEDVLQAFLTPIL